MGGAVVTEGTLPGFRFDLGGSAHILIHHTPIVRELSLARYGLSYIDIDPPFFAPFPDGSRLFVWKDVERTCESIAAISPQDAETYRRFIEDWKPMAQAMADSFLQAPTPLNVARTLGFQSGVHKDLYRRLKAVLGSYGHHPAQNIRLAPSAGARRLDGRPIRPAAHRIVERPIRPVASHVPLFRHQEAQGRFGYADAGAGAHDCSARRLDRNQCPCRPHSGGRREGCSRRDGGGRALHSAAGRRFRHPYSHDAAPLGWSGLPCTRGVGIEGENREWVWDDGAICDECFA